MKLCIRNILFYSTFFVLLACGAEAKESYYYCSFYEDKSISSFDHIFTLIESEEEVSFISHKQYPGKFIKTYTEKNILTTLYQSIKNEKNSRKDMYTEYSLFQLDTDTNTVLRAFAYHMTPAYFEWGYGISYSEENVKKLSTAYNYKKPHWPQKHSELLQYIPENKDPNKFSFVFIKSEFNCKPLGYLGYQYKNFIYNIISILSAG